MLNNSAKAAVAMMCISIVLVFLLCFGFSWRRRDGESELTTQQLQQEICDTRGIEEIRQSLFLSFVTKEELSLYKTFREEEVVVFLVSENTHTQEKP